MFGVLWLCLLRILFVPGKFSSCNHTLGEQPRAFSRHPTGQLFFWGGVSLPVAPRGAGSMREPPGPGALCSHPFYNRLSGLFPLPNI